MKIFLAGNPNVGKSVLFRRLTGIYVMVSNYPGTTVELTTGKVKVGERLLEITDLPGTYSLEPSSEAERATATMLRGLDRGDVIINVLDSTNLERGLGLTLQLIALGQPMIVALNLWDEAVHTGIKIDLKRLERLLDLPCTAVVALTGEGVKNLVEKMADARVSRHRFNYRRRWDEVGRIVAAAQVVTHKHHTLLERFGDASLRPFTGTLIALGAIGLSLGVVRFIGEGLITTSLDPFFVQIWMPIMQRLSEFLGGSGILHSLCIGELSGGGIQYGYSFGLLTTGLYVPFGVVLPYVFAFYLVLSLLEDCGYLPRLAIIADRFMHLVGLHGTGIVPMLLGLGCNVPGALAGRIMESPKERFISTTLMAITVPCMAQVAMIVALTEPYGTLAPVLIAATLMVLWLVLGGVLKRVIKGDGPELLLDVPPYRIPFFKAVIQKVWTRMCAFVKEAVPYVLAGVLLVNFLQYFSVIEVAGRILSPVIVSLLGLPAESIGALIVGFFRKDVAVGMLVPLNMSFREVVIAGVVLIIYFPCVATFMVILRELGLFGTLKAVLIMIVTVLTVGGFLNILLKLAGY